MAPIAAPSPASRAPSRGTGIAPNSRPWRRMQAAKVAKSSPGALRCRRKFLRKFPKGFRDETYIDWERGYKWQAHERWNAALDRGFRELLRAGKHAEIAARAVAIESRTNLRPRDMIDIQSFIWVQGSDEYA